MYNGEGVLPGAYILRQGSPSACVPLVPGILNGYLATIA